MKMEDLSSNDPDPSLPPSSVNDLDLPLAGTDMASSVDGNGFASDYWPWSPDISLDGASDPWTPNLGYVQAPGPHNMPDDRDGPYGDFRHHRQAFSQTSLPYGESTLPGFGLRTQLVCHHEHQHPGVCRLSFNNRGNSHHSLVTAGYQSSTTDRPSFDNSLDERQQAGNAPLAASLFRQSPPSPPQDAARRDSTQNANNEARTSDFSANVGEMFFDLNMEKVKPRKLKKKTTEERESYLNVRRRGGACKMHKLAKRAVSTVFRGFC